MNENVRFIFQKLQCINSGKEIKKEKERKLCQFSENFYKEYHIVSIILFFLSIISFISIIIGNLILFFYLDSINAKDIMFNSNNMLLNAISISLIVVITIITPYFIMPYLIVKFSKNNHYSMGNLDFFITQIISILLLLSVLFLYDVINTYLGDYFYYISVIFVFFLPPFLYAIYLAYFKRLSTDEVLGKSFIMFYISFVSIIFFFSNIKEYKDLFSFIKDFFLFLIIPMFLLSGINIFLIRYFKNTVIIIIVFIFTIASTIVIFKPSLILFPLDLLDKNEKPYTINKEYLDLEYKNDLYYFTVLNSIVSKNNNLIYCGRLLWKQGNIYIFSPMDKENVSYRIDRNNIRLYQGLYKDVACKKTYNVVNEIILNIWNIN